MEPTVYSTEIVHNGKPVIAFVIGRDPSSPATWYAWSFALNSLLSFPGNGFISVKPSSDASTYYTIQGIRLAMCATPQHAGLQRAGSGPIKLDLSSSGMDFNEPPPVGVKASRHPRKKEASVVEPQTPAKPRARKRNRRPKGSLDPEASEALPLSAPAPPPIDPPVTDGSPLVTAFEKLCDTVQPQETPSIIIVPDPPPLSIVETVEETVIAPPPSFSDSEGDSKPPVDPPQRAHDFTQSTANTLRNDTSTAPTVSSPLASSEPTTLVEPVSPRPLSGIDLLAKRMNANSPFAT